MRIRPTLLLALVLFASLAAGAAGQSPESTTPQLPAAKPKRCKTVVKKVRVAKKVHGKKRHVVKKKRVRVCRTVRPNPPSPVIARIEVGADAWIVTAAEDGSVWANGANEVVRIDPAANRITVRTPIPEPAGPSAAAGSIWAGSGQTLTRLDPATGEVRARIAVPHGVAAQVFASPGAIWIPAGEEVEGRFVGYLTRVDPASNSVVATIPMCDVHGYGGAFVDGSVWLACNDTGEVVRLDPATLAVQARIKLGSGIHSMASGAGSVWVTNHETGALSRIDTATNRVVATVDTRTSNVAIVFAEGAVWASGGTGVLKIDPATNGIVGRLPVGAGEYYSLAYASGSLWLSTVGARRVLRLNPTRLSRP
jgi:streptogramin lyase